jgi:UDP-glucose 4-epimerase
MMEKNVLITGASSPIGEQLVLRLLEDSRVGQVLAATDLNHPLSIPERPRLTKVTVDFRKQRRLHELLFGVAKELRINVIVHTSQSESAIKEGAGVHAHNVDSLRSIIDFADRHPSVRRLIIRSAVEVYQVQRDLPVLIAEDHPLNMSSGSPQWVRDRVEADFTACARMGLSTVSIVVLRMAEVLAPGCGSQIFDYLQSPVCLRPIGFDPMLNLLTIEDAAAAFQKAIHSDSEGVFNIPGADSLPLTETIARWGRLSIPLTERGMFIAYRFRRRFRGGEFRYGMNRRRFHYSGVLDGRRASSILRYIPCHPINWPISEQG